MLLRYELGSRNKIFFMFVDIPGYEGLYSCDEFGNIFSYPKIGSGGHNGKLLALRKSNGYSRVTLLKEGKKRYFSVHRIVATIFIPNPENKPQVNHINGIKDDNRVENLEWCTISENGIHSFRVLGNKCFNKGRYGYLSTRGKTVYQYNLQGEFIKEWGSTREIDRELGFSRTGISDCCTGKVSKSNGFIWKYK